MYCLKALTLVATYALQCTAIPRENPTSLSKVAQAEKTFRDNCQAKFKKAIANSCDLYKQEAFDCVRTEWRKLLKKLDGIDQTDKTNEQRRDLYA
eukprot:Pgem_evm1s13400